MKIAVVGAGLAGPLLAQGLTKAGVQVELYEREPSGRRGQGYRIHLAPEGDMALRACLPSELYEQVLATAGKRGSGVRVLDPQLRVLHEMLVSVTPDEERSGRHLTVDRLTLRRIMLTGIDVRHGAGFECYDLLDDGRVRSRFTDGSVTEADLLVAADGTHSPVRAQLLPDAVVRDTGTWLIFGRTPLTEEARALAPAAALDGFCTVAETDGRFMPLAAHEFRGGDDYLMWVVGGPAAMFPDDLDGLDGTHLQEVARGLVADWHESLGALVGLGDPNSVHHTTVRTAERPARWDTVPVTLMGDAIHSMIPAGIGAAVALRDAADLCRRVTEPGRPLRESVRDYEADMLEHGFAAVDESMRMGSGTR